MKKGGFTIIEFLIAMGISAIVAVVVGYSIRQLTQAGNFIQADLTNQQNFEEVFQVMITELRSMEPSGLGAYPIEAVSSSSITFYSDYDADGAVERVRYFIASSTLTRGEIEPTGNPIVYSTSSEVMRDLLLGVIMASSSFKYYDKNYTGTQSSLTYPIQISKIRLISADIVADIEPSTAPQPTYFSNTVTVRNLRSN